MLYLEKNSQRFDYRDMQNCSKLTIFQKIMHIGLKLERACVERIDTTDLQYEVPTATGFFMCFSLEPYMI